MPLFPQASIIHKEGLFKLQTFPITPFCLFAATALLSIAASWFSPSTTPASTCSSDRGVVNIWSSLPLYVSYQGEWWNRSSDCKHYVLLQYKFQTWVVRPIIFIVCAPWTPLFTHRSQWHTWHPADKIDFECNQFKWRSGQVDVIMRIINYEIFHQFCREAGKPIKKAFKDLRNQWFLTRVFCSSLTSLSVGKDSPHTAVYLSVSFYEDILKTILC